MQRALVSVAVAVAVAACGGHHDSGPPDTQVIPPVDAEVAPVFRNPVTLDDVTLAQQALELLGANVANARSSCNNCHGVTRQHIAYWRALSDSAMSNCLVDLQVSSQASARSMIDCLRAMPEVPDSDFETTKLGVYATATQLPWFQYTLQKAYGADAPTVAATFEKMLGMPRGTQVPKLTQAEFDIVAEWFARGVPRLDQDLTGEPAPDTCDAGISADVGTHVAAMKLAGWRAVNASNQMAMHGCTTADPKQCLANVPLGSSKAYGTGWDAPGHGQLRVLAEVTYSTSYWTRSSPDGRFIAHGVRSVPGSYVYDLQRGVPISIDTLYDPGFFPDNSGFVFQGGPRNTCAMSVLTANPTSISMTEPGCSDLQTIGLYQHVGRQLNNGDYFAIDSEFVSDDGGHQVTTADPATQFSSSALVDFIPMIFTGTKYAARPQVSIRTPFEGDAVISPSASVMVSRVSGPDETQRGYVLRRVDATLTGSTYSITTPEIGRYCFSGGKPAFSYDERWMVLHHYVTDADAVDLGFTGAGDPAFQPYRQKGAANIYLLELATGVRTRITNMAPGQYALYPHFRSDGWIYVQIRDINATREYMVASDAALLAE